MLWQDAGVCVLRSYAADRHRSDLHSKGVGKSSARAKLVKVQSIRAWRTANDAILLCSPRASQQATQRFVH